MTREEKQQWMAMWAVRNNAQLALQGECGFGRECVGVMVSDTYPDYEWRDKETCKRIDNNGDVWTPVDAYHKYECVAVLGRGEDAENQLYEWLKWFDENDFKLEVTEVPMEKGEDPFVWALMNGGVRVRMVKQ